MIRLKKRDMELMDDLFRYRALTIKQIRQMYFSENNQSYVYKRLEVLEKQKYVLVKSKFLGNVKVGVVSIGEKGIKALLDEGLIEQSEVVLSYHHRKLNSDYHLKNSLDARNLYVNLRKDGWKFKDSRVFKKERNLNRSCMVLGVLISPSGIDYPLYLIDRNFQDRTISFLMSEIKSSQFERALILYRTLGEKDDYVRIREAHKKAVDSERLIAQVHVLPFVTKSVEIINRTLETTCLVKYFTTNYGEIIQSSNKYMLAPYEIVHEGERKYVMEYLTHDLHRTYSLQLYGDLAHMEQQKKCLVFTWNAYVHEIEPYLKHHSHLEMVVMDISEDIEKIPKPSE
ncbi:hypothetical protein [Paenibacillus agricola]|uniref:Protein involved in plasmid replication-relaxation n=1 Tax=Paenibacillus agricola TaxID=2716264 RepID=A0ABX0JIP8_9BACL|nr:hypothetical protein [Paenibacillus agricola]NHN34872.1 hypothetical protein [Paenibacillus agricola]